MAKPDGNVTGLSWQSSDLASKRLQLALELLPQARRIGLMFDANEPGARIELRGVNAAARAAGVKVQTLELRTAADLEPSLAKLKDARLDALLVSANPLTWTVIDRIVQAAAANRIPVITEPQEFAKSGAIITYGPDIFQAYRRGAFFVDRILKGAVPADLPIEQPTRFDLVVNLKAAKSLGLTVPPGVLSRATKVIR
jgi:putative ABC transport system substrate-binding protein